MKQLLGWAAVGAITYEIGRAVAGPERPALSYAPLIGAVVYALWRTDGSAATATLAGGLIDIVWRLKK